MRWEVHVTRMMRYKKAYEILVGNLKGCDHLEDLDVDGSMILEWILGE
jgi:hypothetical protein